MPSRKPQSSNPASEPGRLSMRRLSSIASLHQLLPFTKNFRSHADSETPSTTSDSSPSMSVTDATKESSISSSTHISEKNRRTLAPSGGNIFQKHGDYASIVDIPSSKLPRSHTLSNLPLPLRSRDKQQRRQATTITNQHQQQSVDIPENTRLPSPIGSSRRYFPFVHRGHNHPGSSARTGLVRSDTEPLLTAKLERDSTDHRVTAFKENQAPDTAHPLPSFLTESDSAISFSSSPPIQQLPRDRSFCGVVPTTPVKSWSDPVWGVDKMPTQSSYLTGTEPVQRQTHALTDVTNLNYPSREHDVVPLSSSSLHSSKVENTTASPRVVINAQPSAYWSGRLSSLLDRYQGQELAANVCTTEEMASRANTDKMHAPSASTARVRRAFEELYTTCVTNDAKESFVAFQLQYAALHNNPELTKPVGPPTSRSKPYFTGSGKSTKVSAKDSPLQSSGSGRKISFVDRLLGRGKRTSFA